MAQKEPFSELNSRLDVTLRSVDLNLITVFDAVMQEQNITRAAQNLGMSQPAVSNAVSRLKQMFNDELFVRNGRGIKPTQRARQLFGPIRQAIQLIKNELPGSIFVPETSLRTFRLAISSPCDVRFAPRILAEINEAAPNIRVQIETEFSDSIANRLRYQEINFVIDFVKLVEPGFSHHEMFKDELVVVVNQNHPRLVNSISVKELQNEKHAVLKHQGVAHSYAQAIYQEGCFREAYETVSLSNILHVVAHSQLIAIAPRWMVESFADTRVKLLDLPLENRQVSVFLNWHASTEKDKGQQWVRDKLLSICSDPKI
ncbi:MAG: transcriptional regulator LeuO [Enterovibrio sp.]